MIPLSSTNSSHKSIVSSQTSSVCYIAQSLNVDTMDMQKIKMIVAEYKKSIQKTQISADWDDLTDWDK